MLFVSSELSKITRDYARIKNAATLSKSIQYYKMTYGTLPESGNEFDIATMLYEEQILSSLTHFLTFKSPESSNSSSTDDL